MDSGVILQSEISNGWMGALRSVMTAPCLLHGLPGGGEALLNELDPRLDRLLAFTHQEWGAFSRLLSGPRSHKVGIAFEALIQWGLEQGLGYTCLARDVQIMDDNRTVGALDLVAADPKGHIEHWELAYKLFLQADEGVSWSSWIGPGGRDRLDIKVNRMLNHQLPLSSTPAAQNTLQALGVPAIERRRILLQGVLFTPWGSSGIQADSARTEAAGRWVRVSDLERVLRDRPSAHWVKREKPLWFGPWLGSTSSALDSDGLRSHMTSESFHRAELWSVLDGNQGDQDLIFVVPDDWGVVR